MSNAESCWTFASVRRLCGRYQRSLPLECGIVSTLDNHELHSRCSSAARIIRETVRSETFQTCAPPSGKVGATAMRSCFSCRLYLSFFSAGHLPLSDVNWNEILLLLPIELRALQLPTRIRETLSFFCSGDVSHESLLQFSAFPFCRVPSTVVKLERILIDAAESLLFPNQSNLSTHKYGNLLPILPSNPPVGPALR